MLGSISGLSQTGNVAQDVGDKFAKDFFLSSEEKSDLVAVLEQAYSSLSGDSTFSNDLSIDKNNLV